MAQDFGTSVAAAAIIAFLIVGIQKIAQPQPECYAVIDGKVYTDQEFVHHEALDALEDVSADSEGSIQCPGYDETINSF